MKSIVRLSRALIIGSQVWLFVVVWPCGSPAQAQDTGSKVTSTEAGQIVTYHNNKRQEVGSPNLVWSARIAQYAQQRADTIARTKVLAHLAQGENPYGENLAQGGGTGANFKYPVTTACEGWYSEKQKLPAGSRVMTVDLFNMGVGHYTQMVWKGSTEIGAGIAHFKQKGYNMTVVVCCYNPGGNIMGAPIF